MNSEHLLKQRLNAKKLPNRQEQKPNAASQFIMSAKTEKIIILQAITFVHQCRLPTVTGFMIETSCQLIPKHLRLHLSKRIQSVSKNSMKPVRISMQTNALPHLLNLI